MTTMTMTATTATTTAPAQLYKDMGLDRDDGLIAAYIPVNAELMNEHTMPDGTLYSVDGCAVDLVMDDEKPVRFWQLKQAARQFRLNHPEPIWTGAAGDFRVQCLPKVPQPADTTLAVRQYRRGPWITLTEEDKVRYD
jgi:hypothetical protein